MRDHYKRSGCRVSQPPVGEPFLVKAHTSSCSTDAILGTQNRDLIVVKSSKVFDAVRECHVRSDSGHDAVACTYNALKKKYYGPTRKDVEVYIKYCAICNRKAVKSKPHKGARNPIRSQSFRDRFQVDLIDMQSQPATHYSGVTMKYIMTVKDHASRFVVLVPLPNKKGATIAAELEFVFSIIGYPIVHHTDNASELCGSLAKDLLDKVRDGNYEVVVLPFADVPLLLGTRGL